MSPLPFETQAHDLEVKISELKNLSSGSGNFNIEDELSRLNEKLDRILKDIYSNLDPCDKVLLARHVDRPHCTDYVDAMIEKKTLLGGDRLYGEDKAILSGLGEFRGRGVVFMGHEKGGNVDSRVAHNFGMPRPEGYRKAVRMMKLADRFDLPIISFIDTAGAYPGVDAEARGQSVAIAQAMLTSFEISVPFVAVVIGEGGSGGAIAISVADRLLMLEHSYYSVISPEGASSILWRDSSPDSVAAASSSLALTAQDWQARGIVDKVIPEPIGGAHRYPDETIERVADAIDDALKEVEAMTREERLNLRLNKYRVIGQE